MRSGRLRHRITLQRRSEGVRDPNTGIMGPPGWAPVTLPNGVLLEHVPAEVLTGPGKEPYESSAKQGEMQARINTRWFPADEMEMTKWRIVWHTAAGVNRIYSIDGPPDTDATARREWRFRCKGGLDDDS